MSNSKAIIDKYKKAYSALHFERLDLFEFIEEKYHPIEVLYPGCSIHIAPAFVFPYVVFVDQNPTAAAFFSNYDAVLDLVNQHRKYRRNPYIQFISHDFTNTLPVRKKQFDLILALYTGGISKACKPYLKIGGYLLTNNHRNDAVEAHQDDE